MNMNQLKVLEYVENENYHRCKDMYGKIILVDLKVDATLNEYEHEQLVGKTVTYEYLYPYVQIAVGSCVVEDKQ